ncbi:MAG: SEC-C domain-containing protein [Gammaproteobacteria bacterium]|nr:SEC-C domain-containing protein [Gammaproteobacteria bacterium]
MYAPDADTMSCPCGSGRAFADCCGPALAGTRPPATPEALMRSRYVAFVRRDAAYLLATWDPATRPPDLDLRDQPDWCGLEVLGSDTAGDAGWVAFAARYRLPEGRGCLRERSRFRRVGGTWLYVDGVAADGAPPTARAGRNDPCPCGSGRKFKRCCGR